MMNRRSISSTTTIFQKNRLFAKYGHVCEMANELDELPILYPGRSFCARMRRAIIRMRLVSEISKYSNQYFRSQGAIANEKHRHLKHHKCIIHPFSDARKWWEFFMCLVFLVQFILIPLDVAFFRIPHRLIFSSNAWKWIRMIADCLCFIDVWLNFITGYYNVQKSQAILSPSAIAFHYLGTYFWVDFISSLPTHVDLFITMDIHSTIFMILQMGSMLKILRFRTFTRYCRDFMETLDVPYAVHRISLITITSILYFHLIACTLVSSYAYNMGYFTKRSNDQIGAPTSHKSLVKDGSYPGAFYSAMIMIGNAGYGSVPPGSTDEIIITLAVWLTSRLLMVLLVGQILQIVRASTSANHKYIEMVRQLREYMSHRQLPEHMQRRLLTYYEFRFQKSYFRESEILSTISGQLRQEIVMHSCRKLVENVAFFKNLPLTLLVRIVSCLRSEVFLINDVIVRANTPGNCMFFIASGTVAVFTSSGREICHLEDGAHFGEIALVMRDELRVASVIAVEVCELYRLDRKEFVRAIHPYPDLLDNIQRIAADRMEKTTMLDEHNRREMASRRLY